MQRPAYVQTHPELNTGTNIQSERQIRISKVLQIVVVVQMTLFLFSMFSFKGVCRVANFQDKANVKRHSMIRYLWNILCSFFFYLHVFFSVLSSLGHRTCMNQIHSPSVCPEWMIEISTKMQSKKKKTHERLGIFKCFNRWSLNSSVGYPEVSVGNYLQSSSHESNGCFS